MIFRDIAIATHLIGMALWVGGIATAALVAAAAARDAEGSRATLVAARRAVLFLATPGMLLAWVAGLSWLVPNFTTLYARMGWMHGKLTILLVLTAITGVLTGRLRRAASGSKPPSAALFGGLGLAVVVLAAVTVFLAILKPGT